MFAVGLSYMAFIMLRYVPSMPAFWNFFFFSHKWLLNFVKGFLCIYWDNHMVFIFQFVNVVYPLTDLQILNNPCIPGIKPTWSWCMIFLICCWILFARILLRIFASMFISDIDLSFSFLGHAGIFKFQILYFVKVLFFSKFLHLFSITFFTYFKYSF